MNLLLDAIFPSTSLRELQEALQIEGFKDFTVVIGDSEIEVHKLMLAIRCPTLSETIKCNPNARKLILNDIDVETFKIILNYIYNDEIPKEYDEQMTPKVFVAAGKLKLEILKMNVGNILSKAVTPESSLELLKLASTHGHDKLRKKSFEELKKFIYNEKLPDEFIDRIDILEEMFNIRKEFDERMAQAQKKKIKSEDQ